MAEDKKQSDTKPSKDNPGSDLPKKGTLDHPKKVKDTGPKK
jgi:hypothetical protein